MSNMNRAHHSSAHNKTGVLRLLTWANVGVLLVNLVITAQASTRDPPRAAAPRRSDVGSGLSPETRPAAKSGGRCATDSNSTTPSAEPTELCVTLSDDQMDRVLEAVYRENRVWRRTAGVLEALSRLQRRGELPEVQGPARQRVVAILRDYAGRRVRLERAVMSADAGTMDLRRAELATFDDRETERIERDLNALFSPAAATRVARVIVPGAS